MKIPMFIMARKNVTLDGQNPTFLYAYGGAVAIFCCRLQGASKLLWQVTWRCQVCQQHASHAAMLCTCRLWDHYRADLQRQPPCIHPGVRGRLCNCWHQVLPHVLNDMASLGCF